MTREDREEIRGVAQAAAESLVNTKLVSILIWIVIAMLTNAGALIGGVAFAVMDRQRIIAGQSDRWTCTMEQLAEIQRFRDDPSYKQVDVRTIQRDTLSK